MAPLIDVHYRRASEPDRAHIRRFHELTDLWREGASEHSEGFADDDVRYVDHWSAESDGAVIVEVDGEVIGGAWLRHFTAEAPGWGFVDEAYPEVAIALEPGFTGQGIGGTLMAEILNLSREQGAEAVSLSVETGNTRARRAYAKSGFEEWAEDGAGGVTMLYRF